MGESVWLWVGFNVFVLAMIALDLLVLHRKDEVMSTKSALGWSGFWIGLALVFNLGVWYFRGAADATAFITAYLLEKSLSVDNLFVILLIFTYFGIPREYQHRVLFWGILGALVFRAIFIIAGVALINNFHWMIYVFGVFLIITGLKMAFQKEHGPDPEKNPVINLFKRFVPVTKELHGHHFFTRIDGRLWATPLFISLLLIEVSDIVFAVDSIPAVLAVTSDPFIVYTSNVFAILGLRSLYFALDGIANQFHYLRYGLCVILVFVGVKMLLVDTAYAIPTPFSLGVIVASLTLSILASLRWPKPEELPAPLQHGTEPHEVSSKQ